VLGPQSEQFDFVQFNARVQLSKFGVGSRAAMVARLLDRRIPGQPI
jgi:hypothetical protein